MAEYITNQALRSFIKQEVHGLTQELEENMSLLSSRLANIERKLSKLFPAAESFMVEMGRPTGKHIDAAIDSSVRYIQIIRDKGTHIKQIAIGRIHAGCKVDDHSEKHVGELLLRDHEELQTVLIGGDTQFGYINYVFIETTFGQKLEFGSLGREWVRVTGNIEGFRIYTQGKKIRAIRVTGRGDYEYNPKELSASELRTEPKEIAMGEGDGSSVGLKKSEDCN
jgi:hypothetical protein